MLEKISKKSKTKKTNSAPGRIEKKISKTKKTNSAPGRI